MLVAGLSLFFVLATVTGLIVLGLAINSDYRVQALMRENSLLMEQIKLTHQKARALQSQIDELVKNDEHLRMVADLPIIDEATRQAGVGGNLTSPGIDPAQDLEILLQKLEQQVEIQKRSYPEIMAKMERNASVVTHTPSVCPVPELRINSGFGYRRDPFTKARDFHHGLDIGCPRGTQVKATADGVIIATEWVPAYGNVLVIDHGFGYRTIYAHLQSFIAKKYQRVKRGDAIAKSGNTGRSTAPHVHYEVRVNNKTVNPLDYIFSDTMVRL
jgi:murein DD-endopeptidase MepM/ murein hydrolase activator NlpD